MSRKKLVSLLAGFLACMLLFTILSRAADSAGVANVKAAVPKNISLDHSVSGNGKVVQNREEAVSTLPNIKVDTIYTEEGSQVEAGALLFDLNMEDIKEQLLKKKQELQKMQLQAKDSQSQSAANAQKKAINQNQASQNLGLAEEKGNQDINQAAQNLETAKQKLDDYRKSQGKDTSEDDTVRKQLEAAVQEKAAALKAAQDELAALEQKIEQEVKQAVDAANAQNNANKNESEEQKKEESEKAAEEEQKRQSEAESQKAAEEEEQRRQSEAESQKASEEEEQRRQSEAESQKASEEEEQKRQSEAESQKAAEEEQRRQSEAEAQKAAEEEQRRQSEAEAQRVAAEEEQTRQSEAEAQRIAAEEEQKRQSEAEAQRMSLEEEQSHQSEAEAQQMSLEEEQRRQSEAESQRMADEAVQAAAEVWNPEINMVGAAQGTTVDPAQAEQEVRNSYQAELDAAKKKVSDAETASDTAQAALSAYEKEKLEKEAASAGQAEQQLIEEVQSRQQAYDTAVLAKKQGVTSAAQSLESAGAPDGSDSSAEISKLEQEALELEISKLEKLEKVDGQIKAPISGLVTKLALTTGDKTPDGMAVLLADTTAGNKFIAQIPSAQEKYIARNDEVVLTPTGVGKQPISGYTVDSVNPSETSEDMLEVTVNLPADVMEIGEAAEFKVEKSSKAYPLCVPVSAINENSNEKFVYVLEETDSVLGTELTARKVVVRILDKNESYAALEGGTISSDQKIITGSDKTLTEGSRVRLNEAGAE